MRRCQARVRRRPGLCHGRGDLQPQRYHCKPGTGKLGNQLESRPCIVLSSDMRLRIQTGDACTYPDIVVLCDKPAFHDGRKDVLIDATLIAEIFHPSPSAALCCCVRSTTRWSSSLPRSNPLTPRFADDVGTRPAHGLGEPALVQGATPRTRLPSPGGERRAHRGSRHTRGTNT
jgi:hypothetical protein